MYCSQCGNRASGKFCCHCGTAIANEDQVAVVEAMVVDWKDSINYETVVGTAEVRTAISRAQAQARQGVSGTQWLQVADALAQPFTGGVSSIAIAKITQPLYAKLGLKTGKQRSERTSLPPGEVLASVLVLLARKGNEVIEVQQTADACQLIIALPADLRGMDGTLSVLVARDPQGTRVSASARIDGQWYDWGKCQRGLDELFQSFRTAA